ncbi:ATPase with role in protein import into the ER [Homalodisca vitripennis]|nr:ATPase with role in protein import into the ER [Homalodisca vitripennis]
MLQQLLEKGLLRLAGLRYDAYVRELSRYWPFNVVDIDGWPHMECTHNGKLCHISPETLLYEILRYFRQFAMKVCGEEDPFFVIAVAGSCTYNQRRAINRAANRAELKSILINDTSAVMISRWLTFRYREHGICVVVDIGGGSVSITSFMVSQYRVRVLSNVGDCHWGGDDFDNTIMSYCFEKMRELMGGDLSSLDKKILRKKCIAAKLELSKEENTTVCLHEHRVEISREMFESWNAERFRQLSALIKRCIKRTKLQKFEILRAFKHGRCCLIPRLSQIIDEHLAPTITVKYDSVSRGAAIYAGMKTGMYYKTVWKTELELKELTPVISVGLHNTKVRKMVERAYLPQSRFRVFRYSAPEVCEVRLNVYELDNKFVRQQILIGGISLLFAQSIIRQSLSLVIFTVTRTFFEVTVYAEDLDNRYSRLELSRHFGDEGRPDQRNWLRALTPLDDMLVRLDSPAQTVDLNSEDNEVNIVTRHIHNRTLIVEGPRPCGCVLYSLNSVFQSCELVLTVTPPQPPAAVNTPEHPYLPPEAVPDVREHYFPPQYEGVPDLTRRDAHAPNVRRPHEYGEMIHPAHPNLPIQTDPHLLEHYTSAGNLSRQPEIQPVVYNPQQYERRSEAVPEIRRPDVALQDVTADYVTRESVIQTVMYNPQQYERRSEAGPEIRRPDVPLRDVRADYVPRESVIQTVMHNPQQYERRSEAGPEIRRPDVPLQDVRADYVTRESVIQTVMHNPQQYERRSEAGPEIRRPDVPLQDVRAGYVTREPETQPAMYNPQQYERRLEAGPEIRRPDVPLQDVRAGYVTREPVTQPAMYNPQQYERRSEAGPEIRRPDVPLQDMRAGYVTREPETQPVMYNPQQYERRSEAGPEIRRPDVPLQDVRAGYVTREPETQPVMYNPQQYERRLEAGPEIRRPDVPLQDVRAGCETREPEIQPVMYNPQQYESRMEVVPQIRRPDVPLQDVRAGYGSRVPEIQPVVYNPQQYEPRTGPIPQIQWPNIPFQDVRPGYGSRVPEIQPVVYNPQQYERRSETVPEIRRPHVPLQDVRAGYATREPEIQPVMPHVPLRLKLATNQTNQPNNPTKTKTPNNQPQEIQPVVYNPQQYEPRTGPIPQIQWPNIPFQDVRPGYGSRVPEIQPVVYNPQQYERRSETVPEIRRPHVPLQDVRAGYATREPEIQPVMYNPQQYEPRTGPIPEIQWHNIPFQDVRPGYGSRIPEIQPVVNFRGPDMQPVTYISQQYLLRMIHGYFPITQGYYVQPQVLNVDHSPRRPDMYPSIHNPQQDRQAVRASYYRPEAVPVRTQRELSNPFIVPADHRYQSSIQEEAIERLPHETFEAEPIVNLDPNTG